MPVVSKEDINIELNNGVLNISGAKKQEKKEENDKYHRVERFYGSFSRSIAVPEGISEEDIKARLDIGVLEVTIPKPPEKKPEVKRITVS